MFVFIIGLNSLLHIYIFLWNMTCKKPILNKEILLLFLLLTNKIYWTGCYWIYMAS